MPVRRLTDSCLFAECKTSSYRFWPFWARGNDKISWWSWHKRHHLIPQTDLHRSQRIDEQWFLTNSCYYCYCCWSCHFQCCFKEKKMSKCRPRANHSCGVRRTGRFKLCELWLTNWIKAKSCTDLSPHWEACKPPPPPNCSTNALRALLSPSMARCHDLWRLGSLSVLIRIHGCQDLGPTNLACFAPSLL